MRDTVFENALKINKMFISALSFQGLKYLCRRVSLKEKTSGQSVSLLAANHLLKMLKKDLDSWPKAEPSLVLKIVVSFGIIPAGAAILPGMKDTVISFYTIRSISTKRFGSTF